MPWGNLHFIQASKITYDRMVLAVPFGSITWRHQFQQMIPCTVLCFCLADHLTARQGYDWKCDIPLIEMEDIMKGFSFLKGGGKTESAWYYGQCLAYYTNPRWWLWSNRWNANWQGKPKYSEKTFPSVTLSTTNPIWSDSHSNPGRRGGKPATNRLSCGMAIMKGYLKWILRKLLPNWKCYSGTV
jgi:hypothetical protein